MHPYRDAERSAKKDSLPFEDHAVFTVLLGVGILGIALGLFFPDRDVDGALGLVLVFFVVRAKVRDVRSARSERRERGSL